MRNAREDRVRERAYALWENEGRPDGRADAIWGQAEREIDSDDGLDTVIAPTPAEAEAAGVAIDGACAGARSRSKPRQAATHEPGGKRPAGRR